MDIKDSDFNAWKHHPVSKMVFKYMKDYRESLIKKVVEDWQKGTLPLATEHRAAGRLDLIDDILNLEFSSIEAFYDDAQETKEQVSINRVA